MQFSRQVPHYRPPGVRSNACCLFCEGRLFSSSFSVFSIRFLGTGRNIPMSIASLGIAGGLAGSGLTQRATEVDRVERESVEQDRAADGERRAEHAGGIGETEQDSQTSDRDADGRRVWER